MTGTNTNLLERLAKAGKVTSAQYEAVRAQVERGGVLVEDALIEQGVLSEDELLKYVASLHKTRFVHTRKLAELDVDRGALKLVPRAVAEEHLICPVMFKPRDKSLAVVAVDPGQSELFEQIKLSSGIGAVKVYAARPTAVRAAIQKHYGGDIHAFAKLEAASTEAFQSQLGVYERNMLDEQTLSTSSVTELSVELPQSGELQFTGEDLARGTPMSTGGSSTAVHETRDTQGGVSALELAQVLVSLLEQQRSELRGHSAQVARLLEQVGKHMGLVYADVFALRLAGLLHDVGKVGNYHLTALNVAEYEGHRTQANKNYLSPVRLFTSADLPPLCIDAITYMYERVDGKGFPDRRVGKDIPLGARLLAIADTYADLTANERNPFRKRLAPKAAVDVLSRYRDRVFDANLVDLFRVAALGGDMQSQLLKDRPRVLLVDTDAEETTVLEMRLVERGCEVVLSRTAKEAFKHFKEGRIDALIVEVELKGHDGFTLVQHIRKLPAGADLPVLFVTSRADRASVDRGFALGCVDYVIKPAAADVVVAKTHNALAKSVRQGGARGVSGSLSEMPLPDVLQVLARTRKTGRLRIRATGHVGEIHVREGALFDASWLNQHGEEAVYALLQLTEGEFALDPGFVPEERKIHQPTESLLLEGMRRMDEASNDFGATRVE